MIALPYQLSFIDWADSLRLLRPDIQIDYRVSDESQWRDYVERLSQDQVCQSVNAPRHDSFANWQDWAAQFIKAFGTNY